MMGMFHQDTQLPTHRTGVPSPSCLATAAGTLGAVDSACGMTWMNSHHLFWRSLTYLKKHASRDHHPKYGITHGWNRQQLMQLSGLWLLKLDTNPPWNLQHKDKEWLEPNFAFVILPDYLGFASGTPQKVKQYQNISNIFPTDSSSSGFPSKKTKNIFIGSRISSRTAQEKSQQTSSTSLLCCSSEGLAGQGEIRVATWSLTWENCLKMG